ncbi:MAG: hypothetical protein JRI68_07155 [Deltaproteobacteria bacterium]|nr:hypothetical protein [Deltaproteobacteria bacterium]
MGKPIARWAAAIALCGAVLGLVFSAFSTSDYLAHLDRQLHDIRCSFIPGAAAGEAAENACQAALYSSYSAVFRDHIWGGIPISLFAIGAFSFFTAFATYLLVSGRRAPRRASQFLALTGWTPVIVSIVMAVISATQLGSFCKTCVGTYVASLLVALGGTVAWWHDRKEARHGPQATPDAEGAAPGSAPPLQKLGPASLIPTWLAFLGLFAVAPALVYHEAVPSYAKHVEGCGKLESTADPKKALLHFTPAGAKQPVFMVVDPLCATCGAFHRRLEAEGIFDQLDTTLVLFPLDSECNWNLTTPLHPGACAVSEAVLCAESRALQVLEWGYEEVEALLAAGKGKGGVERVVAKIEARWPALKGCIGKKETRMRLDEMIRFAVTNKLEVATPQLFVGTTRLCDEDSDIGLPYALRKLAPALAKR